MPETCRYIYDNKSQLLHQVGTSRHFHIWCTVTHTWNSKWIRLNRSSQRNRRRRIWVNML